MPKPYQLIYAHGVLVTLWRRQEMLLSWQSPTTSISSSIDIIGIHVDASQDCSMAGVSGARLPRPLDCAPGSGHKNGAAGRFRRSPTVARGWFAQVPSRARLGTPQMGISR